MKFFEQFKTNTSQNNVCFSPIGAFYNGLVAAVVICYRCYACPKYKAVAASRHQHRTCVRLSSHHLLWPLCDFPPEQWLQTFSSPLGWTPTNEKRHNLRTMYRYASFQYVCIYNLVSVSTHRYATNQVMLSFNTTTPTSIAHPRQIFFDDDGITQIQYKLISMFIYSSNFSVTEKLEVAELRMFSTVYGRHIYNQWGEEARFL
jgi:hypothetical protein